VNLIYAPSGSVDPVNIKKTIFFFTYRNILILFVTLDLYQPKTNISAGGVCKIAYNAFR
jgi:hypothetical protein